LTASSNLAQSSESDNGYVYPIMCDVASVVSVMYCTVFPQAP
jgi:hypothetical protein